MEIGVWSTAWNNDQVASWMDYELVITMAAPLIDRYADQDGPLVRIQIQSSNET